MTAPLGLGMWIAFLTHADNGQSQAIVDRCQRSGIKWLAVKSGDTARGHSWNASLVQKIKDAGIGFYSWNYSYPNTWRAQIDHVASCLKDGVDGHILDPETEWTAPGSGAQASLFVDALRERVGPDAYLAYAPFDYRKYHPDYPFSAFDRLGNVMPQTYFCEHNDLGAKHNLDDILPQWAQSPAIMSPIGVTYGKGSPWGHPPGTLREEDLIYFLDNAPGPCPSLYSYEAAMPMVWKILSERL